MDSAPAAPRARNSGYLGGDWLFWAAAAFMLFWNLGVRELWTAEDRWAEVARWMRFSGDYLHPLINGQPYFDKPLLGYWTIVAAAWVTGGVNEWALRFPSALAGWLALIAVRRLGWCLWGPVVGRTAGWILLASHGFLFWARTGQADMENLAFSLLAVAWYWAARDRASWIKWSVFYLLCFIGAQMKGLAALAVPVLAIAPDMLRVGRWKEGLRPGHLFGVVLGLAVYLLPFIAESVTRGDYSASGLTLVFRENVQRYFNPFDHKEPFYVYFYYLPLLFLPWSLVWLIGLGPEVQACRRERRYTPTRWLLEAGLLVFLFFTASGSRRSYYILPLVPLCALMTAVWLETAAADDPARRWALRIQAGICALLTAICALAAPAAWFIQRRGIELPVDLKLGALLLSLLALLPWWLARARPAWIEGLGVARGAAPHLLATAILLGGYYAVLHPATDALRTRRAFTTGLRALALPAAQVGFYRTPYASVAFYFNGDRPHPQLDNPAAALAFLRAAPGNRVLVLTRRDWDELEQAADHAPELVQAVAEWSFSWEKKTHRKLVAAVWRSAAGENADSTAPEVRY